MSIYESAHECCFKRESKREIMIMKSQDVYEKNNENTMPSREFRYHFLYSSNLIEPSLSKKGMFIFSFSVFS